MAAEVTVLKELLEKWNKAENRLEPEAQEQVMQIVTSWMRTGIEQGRREGEVSIVMRLLKRKVGNLTRRLRRKFGICRIVN